MLSNDKQFEGIRLGLPLAARLVLELRGRQKDGLGSGIKNHRPGAWAIPKVSGDVSRATTNCPSPVLTKISPLSNLKTSTLLPIGESARTLPPLVSITTSFCGSTAADEEAACFVVEHDSNGPATVGRPASSLRPRAFWDDYRNLPKVTVSYG
jgi:hypothetical protein